MFAKFGGLMAPVTKMILTSNDAFLIISCEDETVKVFALVSGTLLNDLQGRILDTLTNSLYLGHDGKAYCLAAAQDDCQLYVGNADGVITVYDLHTAEVIKVHKCGTRAIVNSITVRIFVK
jgi:WD40 repeat protein